MDDDWPVVIGCIVTPCQVSVACVVSETERQKRCIMQLHNGEVRGSLLQWQLLLRSSTVLISSSTVTPLPISCTRELNLSLVSRQAH